MPHMCSSAPTRRAPSELCLLVVPLRVLPHRWCALPGGNGEPERVTDLGVLPLLAKVYVKPAQINLITVVHNGDLEHIMAMEVANVVRGCPATQNRHKQFVDRPFLDLERLPFFCRGNRRGTYFSNRF